MRRNGIVPYFREEVAVSPQTTRRRGQALEAAIFEAALAELAATGRAKLTMEAIAQAAHTGKATLYRRWSTLDELLADALAHVLPDPTSVPVHDTLRADLIELLTLYCQVLEVTHHAAYAALKDDGAMHDVVRERAVIPIRRLIAEAVDRGTERGEVRADAHSELLSCTGPALITYHCLTESADIPAGKVTEIVDGVLLPALLR